MNHAHVLYGASTDVPPYGYAYNMILPVLPVQVMVGCVTRIAALPRM